MSSFTFNSSFTRQFRQEQSATFRSEEKTIHHIAISTFRATNDTSLNNLAAALNKQLFDNDIIGNLLTKLNGNDSRDSQRLAAFVLETYLELNNHASAEPFTAAYYKHLLDLLSSFQDLLQEYETDGRLLLLSNLTAANDNNPTAHQSVDSEEVATMHKMMEEYLYQIGEYYQYFHLLLQKEGEQEDEKSRVQVLSHVAYYLDTLITCTEKTIINIEGTLDLLLDWESSLQNREAQQLFN